MKMIIDKKGTTVEITTVNDVIEYVLAVPDIKALGFETIEIAAKDSKHYISKDMTRISECFGEEHVKKVYPCRVIAPKTIMVEL